MTGWSASSATPLMETATMTNHYIVKETVTLLYYIEAESEEEARLRHVQRGIRDFDEVDSTIGTTVVIEKEED